LRFIGWVYKVYYPDRTGHSAKGRLQVSARSGVIRDGYSAPLHLGVVSQNKICICLSRMESKWWCTLVSRSAILVYDVDFRRIWKNTACEPAASTGPELELRDLAR
jgi:hypothetical protein